MAEDNFYPVELEDLYPGTSFFYGKNAYNSHLHFILTDPEEIHDAVLVVMVNLTTQRQGSDNTVILNPGDHPFIKRPSVVAYVHSALISAEQLLRYINQEKSLHPYVLEDDVLRRIQQGLLESEFTPLAVLEYCQERFQF